MKRTHTVCQSCIKILILCFSLAPLFCFAVVRQVPSEYLSIQGAIDASDDGDEIIVSPLTYLENINLGGKNVILRSTDPANPNVVASTIIDGKQGGSVVTFSGTELTTCVISGFTIANGPGPSGGGIYGNGTLATIQNNIITSNTAYYGGGVYDCDGTIQNNTIWGNWAYYGGGLIWCNGTIQNNIIYSNSANIDGGGLHGCQGLIQNNTIYNNAATRYGGGLYSCGGTIRNNIIWENSASNGAQLHNCATPSYSCIQNWTGDGTANITSNPRLVDPANGDFHLQSSSPCIDAGCYSDGLLEDFEGDARPYNGTLEPRGDGTDYDIGADEYYPLYSFNFDTGAEGWVFSGTIIPFDAPSETSSGGHLGLSPSGSSYCFGYWGSPELSVHNGVTYRARFSVASSLSTGESVPECRLRVNQLNWYGSATREIISGGDGGGAPLTTPRNYELLFTPLLSVAEGTVVLSFDILNFDPNDDANAWLYLESVTIEEVSVSP